MTLIVLFVDAIFSSAVSCNFLQVCHDSIFALLSQCLPTFVDYIKSSRVSVNSELLVVVTLFAGNTVAQIFVEVNVVDMTVLSVGILTLCLVIHCVFLVGTLTLFVPR